MLKSGDTALRGLRLTIADTLHIDQSTNGKRLGLSAIIFALVAGILVWAKTSPSGFSILWRYFAWSNQTLALFAFAAITGSLYQRNVGTPGGGGGVPPSTYVWPPSADQAKPIQSPFGTESPCPSFHATTT